MVAKKRANARKTPEIVRFRGFEAMISFLASLYGSGTRILNLESRVCWCESFCYCLRDSLQALTGLSRFDFTCVVSQNKKSIRSFLLIRMNYEKQKQSGGKDEQFRLFVLFVLRKAL